MSEYFDYNIIKNYGMYHGLVPLAKAVIGSKFDVSVIGTENIPAEGGFILASNHITALDPVILALKCTRIVHFMSKYEAFKNPFSRFFLTHFNAFPVKRGSSDKSSVEYAIKLVKSGEVLGIFPEGVRTKDGKPTKPKSGVALIAKDTNSDVLPTSIFIEGKSGTRKKVTVRFGKIIKFDELGFTDGVKSTSELRNASRKVFDEIVSLWEMGH